MVNIESVKKLDNIIQHCADTGIEIVSHGLAPNPNGFCYELPENVTKSDVDKLDKMLKALTKSEEQQLIEAIF